MKTLLSTSIALGLLSTLSHLYHCFAQPVELSERPKDAGFARSNGTSLAADASRHWIELFTCPKPSSYPVGSCISPKGNVATWTVQDCVDECTCTCSGALQCPEISTGSGNADCFMGLLCYNNGGCTCSHEDSPSRADMSNVSFVTREVYPGASTTCSAASSAVPALSAFSVVGLVTWLVLIIIMT